MKRLFVVLSLLVLGLHCEDFSTNGISENLPVKEGGDVVLHCHLGNLPCFKLSPTKAILSVFRHSDRAVYLEEK